MSDYNEFNKGNKRKSFTKVTQRAEGDFSLQTELQPKVTRNIF